MHSIWIPLAISLGAIPGALSRYYLTLGFARWLGSGFPYGTLFINLSGSLLIGFFATVFQITGVSTVFSLLIITGFLGSYTTFSTYELDVSTLFRTGNYQKALLYFFSSPVVGLLCVKIGIALAHQR